MRLHTLPVSVAGVLAGTAVAAMAQSVKVIPASICLLFAILAQIVSNFANEYYDFRNGVEKKGREGFRRGVAEGDISPKAMRNATFGVLALACLTGLSLIYWGGWWLLIPGILIALFALAYSAGPYPLSHHGWGEVAVVIFFGLVPVLLTAYVQIGEIAFSPTGFCMGAGIGLLAANVLIVNNYRDADDDRALGKYTIAVKFGRPFVRTLYFVEGIVGLVLCGIAFGNDGGFMLRGLLAISGIGVYTIYTQMKRSVGASLNPLLGKTAMLLLFTSVVIMIMAIIK